MSSIMHQDCFTANESGGGIRKNMEKARETEHSKNYKKVMGYYDGGYWSEARVKNAVAKGWITASEYEEITEDNYDG